MPGANRADRGTARGRRSSGNTRAACWPQMRTSAKARSALVAPATARRAVGYESRAEGTHPGLDLRRLIGGRCGRVTTPCMQSVLRFPTDRCYPRAAVGPSSLVCCLTFIPSRCGAFDPYCGSGGKVVPQSLCPELADVELSTDRTHRGNPVRRELLGEQLRHPFLQRVRVVPGLWHTVGGNLRTADYHHEEFV
jgi:hypothetical protein